MDQEQNRIIEWGVAAAAFPGQSESGDHSLVKFLPDGALVAVVDGIGHGQEAAVAAKAALGTLEAHAQEHVIPLFGHCHRALGPTRGVAMSLAAFNAEQGSMTWLGVGNVNGILLRPDLTIHVLKGSLLLRAGIVGRDLPPLKAAVLPIKRGDMLIFVTDGVRKDFEKPLLRRGKPQEVADRILAENGTGTDDALVLVARYLGKDS
jgi:serine/threonine protein phosphatase PrpC